jgi:hypothetical protein
MDSFGNLGVVSINYIRGWATIKDATTTPEIIIELDGKQLLSSPAGDFRKDILEKKLHPTGYCGFHITRFDREALSKASVLRAFIKQTGVELKNSPYFFKNKMSEIETMENPPFVFIHIPKTAGTSFRIGVQEKFNDKSIIMDYKQHSNKTSQVIQDTVYSNQKHLLVNEIIQRNKIKFITGHFTASKYLDIFDTNVRWCTFFRDPIQRVISEYNHLVSRYGYDKSLQEFCILPNNCNKQFNAISGIKLDDFFFFGITEYYNESITLFNKLTNMDISSIKQNIGRKIIDCQYNLNTDLLELIQNNNLKDIELYQQAVQKFLKML